MGMLQGDSPCPWMCDSTIPSPGSLASVCKQNGLLRSRCSGTGGCSIDSLLVQALLVLFRLFGPGPHHCLFN